MAPPFMSNHDGIATPELAFEADFAASNSDSRLTQEVD